MHDISASGNTIYIEPREVVKLSEEIASLRADERYEMLRILQEISERVRPHAAEIANDAWIIGHLDLIRAKVRFIQERQAVVSSAVRKSGNPTAPCLPSFDQKCRRK